MTAGKNLAVNRGDAAELPIAAALADHGPRSKPTRAWVVFAIKLIAGISLVALLVWHYDLHAAFQLIRRERPALFLAAVALYVAGQLMSAFRWQLLAGLNGLPGSYSEYLAYYFVGMFTNLFV